MKKSLSIIALAALAFVGCSKIIADAPINKTEDKGQEINFQVATYMGQTKAEGNTTTYPTNVSFGTYAWYKGTGDPAPDPAVFMDNQEISYQSNVWKAVGQTYYWPKTGSIDFISYSPYNSSSPWLDVAANTLTASTTGVAADADYLYSNKALNQTQNTNTYNNTGVPTLFHHALCKVCVKIKVAKTTNDNNDVEWVVKLKQGAQIKNYATNGTLELNLGTSGAWDLPENDVWNATEFNQSLSCAAQTLPYTLTTDATDILALTTVMPQTLSNQALALSFEITTTTKARTTITEEYTTSINLKSGMGSSAPAFWQMNKKITYTVTVDPEGSQIYFDPAVADWGEASGEHTYSPEQ